MLKVLNAAVLIWFCFKDNNQLTNLLP